MVNKESLNFALMVLLAISMLVSLVLVIKASSTLHSGEQVVPSGDSITISLTAIKPVGCEKCADVQQLIDAMEQTGSVNLSSKVVVNSDSAEGKALIKKYSFTRLPAMVLQGDIDKLPSENLERVGDAIVVRELPPPFYDIENDTVSGLVDVTYITAPSCSKCKNITGLTAQLELMGIVVGKESQVAYDSDEGKALVKKFNISAVPTAMFSSDAGYYPVFQEAWDGIGTVDDGWYVMRALSAPYFDFKTGGVRGIVSATFLNDSSCKDCYDPLLHKTIMAQNFGITFDQEKVVDVNSDAGKELVKKYTITAVPTIVMTGDVEAYPSFTQSWPDLGSSDGGVYVFRALDLIQGMSYKNLTSGEVVANAEAAQEPVVAG